MTDGHAGTLAKLHEASWESKERIRIMTHNKCSHHNSFCFSDLELSIEVFKFSKLSVYEKASGNVTKFETTFQSRKLMYATISDQCRSKSWWVYLILHSRAIRAIFINVMWLRLVFKVTVHSMVDPPPSNLSPKLSEPGSQRAHYTSIHHKDSQRHVTQRSQAQEEHWRDPD